jgi:hypothetical protein
MNILHQFDLFIYFLIMINDFFDLIKLNFIQNSSLLIFRLGLPTIGLSKGSLSKARAKPARHATTNSPDVTMQALVLIFLVYIVLVQGVDKNKYKRCENLWIS